MKIWFTRFIDTYKEEMNIFIAINLLWISYGTVLKKEKNSNERISMKIDLPDILIFNANFLFDFPLCQQGRF